MLGNRGHFKQQVLRAKVPPDNDQKSIGVDWTTPQGFTFAPSIHVDDKKKHHGQG